MINMGCYLPWLLLSSLIIFSAALNQHVFVSATPEKKAYIVYMGEKQGTDTDLKSIHLNLLDRVLEGSSSKESLLYSYGKSFSGFAAMLTEEEQNKLAGVEDVVSVFPSETMKLHTSKSWDFLGFPSTVERLPDTESDVIIGMLDSGIWPESESFNDDGIGPPPKKWKGACQNFKCNNKIIGARYYNGEMTKKENSPRDTEGHGTHTASTAAGREVKNISLYGIAKGTVRGAVPSARIAVYKVCWAVEGDAQCRDHDVLAAFDDAIADGVDFLSASFGFLTARPYYEDAIAIGSFHAMKKGILTSAAAGNSGVINSVTNCAPWILTVGAVKTNHQIISNITLGSNMTLEGFAINTYPTGEMFVPLIYGRDASKGNRITENASACSSGSLNKSLVKGKIVICTEEVDGIEPRNAGAEGAVIAGYQWHHSKPYLLPATAISIDNSKKLYSYMNSTRKPVAIIHHSEDAYDSSAVSVSDSSSRGYNIRTPDILKPDLAAPGVDILAAWSPKSTVSTHPGDDRHVEYNIVTGTSMACPHATGAAAYVKSFHPSWSPAAIRSALMTTAAVDALEGHHYLNDEYAYGSGLIDPLRAVNPGLIYDSGEDDYIQMLCVSLPAAKIRAITGGEVTCRGEMKSEAHMNYPSMSSVITKLEPFRRYFPRTLTNVGSPNSTYKVSVSPQPLLNISVTPDVLHFKSLYEKQSFTVNISGGVAVRQKAISARISWSDGLHKVTSPILVWVE